MVKVLVDTSIFIDYARTGKGSLLTLLEDSKNKKIKLTTCGMVLFEFWSGKSLNNPQNISSAELLFKNIEVVPFSVIMAKKAGELKRNGIVEGVDAMIAAVSIETNSQLASLNKKHFELVKELKIWQHSAS